MIFQQTMFESRGYDLGTYRKDHQQYEPWLCHGYLNGENHDNSVDGQDLHLFFNPVSTKKTYIKDGLETNRKLVESKMSAKTI